MHPTSSTNARGSSRAPGSGSRGSGRKKSANNRQNASSSNGNWAAVVGSSQSASSSSTSPSGFGNSSETGLSASYQRVLRHRSLFAFRSLVGKMVDVELRDASRYIGILDCIDPDDYSVVLKSARQVDVSTGRTGSTVVFNSSQIAQISADGAVTSSEVFSSSSSGFRTDTEISSNRRDNLYGRELETASSWLDPSLDTGELEDARCKSKDDAWDQFKANEKLFGVKSSFDENLYTTKLDKNKISSAQSKEAARIAAEIEGQTSKNFHLQEERGQKSQNDGPDVDEEAKYSSVGRKPGSYIPPAQRKQQQQQKPAEKPVEKTKDKVVEKATDESAEESSDKPKTFSDAVTGKSTAFSSSTEAEKPRKGLNPNAKEFKLSATATAFTPSFLPKEPAYTPPPSEEYLTPAYTGYEGQEWGYEGAPMGDDMMQPYMYMPMAYPPPMVQPPNSGRPGREFGYQQQYQRGYYNQPPPGSVGYGSPMQGSPQPPLPQEPTPDHQPAYQPLDVAAPDGAGATQ